MRINKKKMFAAVATATLVSSAFVSTAPQTASAAVTTSTAKSLVSKAESSAYRLHTLYTTVGRYGVIRTELTTAKSQYASALKAVNSLPSSSTKTDLTKRLQKVKGYIDRATNFNNALYAASAVYKHIDYLEMTFERDTYNRTQLKAEFDKQQRLIKTMETAIGKLYSRAVADNLRNKYQTAFYFSQELDRIVNDKQALFVLDVTESKHNILNVIVSDVSGLNSAAAMNKNNYKIDGKVIPANSVIKVLKSESQRSIIQITLPGESISQTKPHSIAVSGLKDKHGTINSNEHTDEVNLTENVSPVLKEVIINEAKRNQLIFSYSEPLAKPINPADIKIILSNDTVIPASKIRVTPELNDAGEPTGRDLVSLDTDIYQQVDMWDQYYIEMDGIGGYDEHRDYLIGASDNFDSFHALTVGTNASTVSTDKSLNRNLLKGNTTIKIIDAN
ncbi:hypothetical protein [Bacillus sp. CECT 9360]|uniref:hypothetical protein n=1 Tax=Bacillus sp. CECT 9360 TaxID=2845821 RepID=UPI001E60F9A9|nr:hypothetical protein [Bacillus sp. CECT 9360]CAH0345145.1 hypothetical protein BCI9360_01424 [Bacillus sp. CECT 9360]